MSRITPLSPPYAPETEASLARWMGAAGGREPLALFRVLEHHPDLASRMRVLGSGLLGHGTLPAVERETVVQRVCARAGCSYEWGVHAEVFAGRVGLTPRQLRATVVDDEAAWTPRQAILVRVVDELHDDADLGDGTWAEFRARFEERQIVEVLVLAGWYRTIAYVANALRLPDEEWAAPFPKA
ncbi:carboxymuconolactone decarboxylase family protein [Embleya hyalina]|uniref:Carboxymuconolactone decarboxylase n=1 Tax=Embleya hyalina TaxID=516124 RepID=A0A401YJ81_9ACTN|nr:carboxymuconolactone decarboxylase family protein [Embleya hyalina]GCD94628.1 carboxymuconolactone decarboxylase [Embleya hyalina]